MSEIITLRINDQDVEYTRSDLIKAQKEMSDKVIIRTYSAGVHIGNLVSRVGQEVVLANAVRLYSWSGAFTLNSVATNGVDRKNSRISKPVSEITLLQAIEIIPVCAGIDLSSTDEIIMTTVFDGSGDGNCDGDGSGDVDGDGDGSGSGDGYGSGDGDGYG